MVNNGQDVSPSFVLRQNQNHDRSYRMDGLKMSVASSPGQIQTALKKPSKTVAVGLEYVPKTSQTKGDIETLSMQLRKAKASALWTSDLGALALLADEQQSAAGNFPGPCPVIFNGAKEDLEQAVTAGASAVVLDADSMEKAANTGSAEIIWEVATKEEVSAIVEAGYESAFLVAATDEKMNSVIEAIPESAAIIAVLDAMQDENEELEQAKELKALGCTSVLVKKACVGDGEDIEYAVFVVDGMTKKKSSQFNMTGLTGSTNGHFGGVASSVGRTWLRMKR